MGSIFGSKGTKSSGTTTGGGTSSGSSNSISTGSSTSTQQSQSSTDPGFMTELQAVLNRQLSGTTGFTKQDAINDVQGTLRTQATDALQSVMPTIARSQSGAGAYNSTTKQLLQNDAESRITAQLAATTQDQIAKYAQIEQGLIGAFSGATQAGTSQSASSSGSSNSNQSSSSVSNQVANSWNNGTNSSKGGGSGLLGLFADGGQVPLSDGSGDMDEFFAKFLAATGIGSAAEKAAATASNPSAQGVKDTMKAGDNIGNNIENFLLDSVFSMMGFEAGGQVPSKESDQLRQAIMKHMQGGKSRDSEKDIQAGGKIQGPESKTGEDNQVIAVGGGEGILAKDVMEVPGVANLVEFLNSKYHKPTQSM